jgi:hypothetical protein
VFRLLVALAAARALGPPRVESDGGQRWMKHILQLVMMMRTVCHAIEPGMIRWLLEAGGTGIVAVTASTANGNSD